MQETLKKQLNKLDNKYLKDADIITLQVFCNLPETEENWNTIKLILQKIVKKYPEDKSILELIPKYEINYDKLKEYLVNMYPDEIEIKILEKLLTYTDNKKEIFTDSLKRLIKKYPTDLEILKFLKLKKYIKSDFEDNMVFVEGTKKSDDENKEICDLYVSKFQVTEGQWLNLMGNKEILYGAYLSSVAMYRINWINALKYCNKLSQKHGLQPIYKLENDELIKVIYKNGKEVNPSIADFEKTEGYRLPTSLEWEWFANGGVFSKEKKRFAGSKYINSVGWHLKNSGDRPHSIGQKLPNELEIYDCTGNVKEWCYDTTPTDNYKEYHNKYIYDKNSEYRILKGGSYGQNETWIGIFNSDNLKKEFSLEAGLRIVRTAFPK